MDWIAASLAVYAALMLLGTLGIIIHRSLPSWREDRRNLVEDLQGLLVLSFVVAIAVAFLSFFGMLVAATHQQAQICVYSFVGSVIYAVVIGAASA